MDFSGLVHNIKDLKRGVKMAKSVNATGRMSVGRFEEEFEKTFIKELSGGDK